MHSPLRLFLLGSLLFCAPRVFAAEGVIGTWIEPAGSAVRIDKCSSGLCATLVSISKTARSHMDIHNPDASMRTRPLCNLQIGSGFRLTDPSHAEDGHLYDPKSGKTYSGAMYSEGDTLHLRGYVGLKIFGRSEIWKRTNESKTCSD